MKTLPTVNSDPQLSRAEAELSAAIRAVFGRFPDLAGFSFQNPTGLPGYIGLSGLQEELFLTELGFSVPVDSVEYEKAYNVIADAVADIVSERPEAFELLRGRTFARVFH
jgi:hypothetical protein